MSCKGCGGTARAAAARLTAPADPGDETQFIVDYPNGDVGRHGWDEAQSAVALYGAVIRNDPGMRSLAPDEESNGAQVTESTEVPAEVETEVEAEVTEVVDSQSIEQAADDAAEVTPDASTEGAQNDE